jgi:leucyl aminopeptidase
MHFKIKSGDPAKAKTPCLIVGVFDKRKLADVGEDLDKASDGALKALLGTGDMDGRSGTCLMAYDLPGIAAERVLLVGCGKRKELDRKGYGKALGAALTRLGEAGVAEALWTLADLPNDLDLYQAVRLAAEQAAASAYRYEHTKKPAKDAPEPLKGFGFWIGDKGDSATAERAASHAGAIAAGVALARDLGNLPGNICTPSYLAERALGMAAQHDKLQVEVLDEDAMAELEMGALLSVSRGSRQPARLIVFKYQGGKDGDKPVVLVGKGLTFDAGGISIKPAEAMDEMKYDMCGGAGVFGAVTAACAMDLPLNLIGVVPASENLPDGAANKPGDIVTSMSGQTIEILNTDAEGRLILCDALTYVERFDPAVVIDMATLTGACIVALGRHPSGLFSDDEKLVKEVTDAGDAAGDRVWRLPLWDDYQKQLDSNFADMANIGGRDGGAVTAACFLARFTKKYRWAHLDIAGTAWVTGKEKGATGRPVPLLGELLIRRAGVKQ